MSHILSTILKKQGQQLQITNLSKGEQSSAGTTWNCELLSQVAPYSFPGTDLKHHLSPGVNDSSQFEPEKWHSEEE